MAAQGVGRVTDVVQGSRVVERRAVGWLNVVVVHVGVAVGLEVLMHAVGVVGVAAELVVIASLSVVAAVGMTATETRKPSVVAADAAGYLPRQVATGRALKRLQLEPMPMWLSHR